jgi:hypothetical protein
MTHEESNIRETEKGTQTQREAKVDRKEKKKANRLQQLRHTGTGLKTGSGSVIGLTSYAFSKHSSVTMSFHATPKFAYE